MTDQPPLNPLPGRAHDALRSTMHDLGNGPVWQWCNSTASPDPTTAAYMDAIAALEALRGHLVHDAATAYREALP